MKKKLLLLTLIMVLILPTMVFADSFKFGAQLAVEDEPKIYKENDEITIEMNISDINVGELGINTIEGILEYDEDIFVPVNNASFRGENGWSFTYNEGMTGQKGKFLGMVLSAGVKEEQKIGKITLKVKEEVKKNVNSTDIKIKDLKTNNGVEFVNEENKVIQIPLDIEYSAFNPMIIVVIIAIIAILLGLISILNKRKK